MASSSSVFVQLKLVGASKFATDAKGVSVSLDSVGGAAVKADEGLTSVGRSSTVAESRLGRLALATKTGVNGLSGLRSTASGVVSALGKISAVVGAGAGFGLYEAAKGAINFDTAMRNVNSIAQLAPAQFSRLEKSVAGLAGPTAQAPVTLANGLYDLVSSGFNARQSLVILRASARAATAGLTDTATSTKAVAAVLNAYQLGAGQASHVSDILFQTVNRGVISFSELASNIGTVLPFAAALHVNLSQVGAAISTMTKQGVSGELSITYLKNAMVAFTKPSTGLAAAISKTGAASGEALIKSKGFEGALRAVIGTTNGSKAAISKLFPNIRASAAVLALTGRNAKTAAGDLKSFQNVNGATNKALSQQSQSISYQWRQLKDTIAGSVDVLALKFQPQASKALSTVSRFLQGVTGQNKTPSAKASVAGHQAHATTAPTGAAGVGATVRNTIGNVASAVLPVIQNIAKTVIPAAKQVVTQLIAAFKPATPFLKNVLLPLLVGFGKGVLGSVVLAFKVAIPIIRTVSTVLGALGKVLAPLRPVFQTIGEVIGVLVGPAVLKAAGELGRFETESRLVSTVLKAVAGAARALLVPVRVVEGALRTVGGIFRVAASGVSRFSNAVVFMNRWLAFGDTAFERLLGKVTNFVAGAIGQLERMPGRAQSAIQSMIGRITGRLGSAGKAIVSAAGSLGRSVVNGMVNAIKAAPGAITSAIMGIVPKPLRGALGGILGTAGNIGHAAKNLGQGLLNKLGLASGGVVRSPVQVVGERGPELAALPMGTRVFNARDTRMMLGRGGPTAMAPTRQTTVIQNHVHLDGRQIHYSVYKHEQRLAEAS